MVGQALSQTMSTELLLSSRRTEMAFGVKGRFKDIQKGYFAWEVCKEQ